jgi:hypothetical protein
MFDILPARICHTVSWFGMAYPKPPEWSER